MHTPPFSRSSFNYEKLHAAIFPNYIVISTLGRYYKSNFESISQTVTEEENIICHFFDKKLSHFNFYIIETRFTYK